MSRRLQISVSLLAMLAAVVIGGRPVRRAEAGQPVGDRDRNDSMTPIDGLPRWSFRTRSPVTVNSPIVRLGDIVQPVGPEFTAWPRLSRSPIGLVPLDATPMIIRRDRIGQAMRSAEGTSQAIDWSGPKKIEVVYQPDPTAGPEPSRVQPASGSARAAASDPTPSPANGSTTSGKHSVAKTRLDPNTAQRLVRWIQSAVQRQYPETAERLEVVVDPQQAALARLESVQGIERVEFRAPPREGTAELLVIGRDTGRGPQAMIDVELKAYPQVVMAAGTFRRGHRLSRQDVTLKPWSKQRWESSFVTDPKTLVGMEVRQSLHPDRPVERDDVGPPILVRRGDLVEIRVVGRAITVTTDATAVDEGAQGDLIEVRTLEPRKTMVARVVGSGLVEIITRAPQVPR